VTSDVSAALKMVMVASPSGFLPLESVSLPRMFPCALTMNAASKNVQSTMPFVDVFLF
jgi:hypothetical protein